MLVLLIVFFVVGQTSQKPGNFEDQLVRELLGLLNANTMSLLPETTLDALLAFLSNAGSRADSQALLVSEQAFGPQIFILI